MCTAFIDKDGTWKAKIALLHKNSPSNAFDQWFDLLIDTGAEKTVLSLTAAIGTNWNFNSLPKSGPKICGVNGQPMETWVIDRAELVFMCGEHGDFHIETVENLLVADTRRENYFGLIGRDVSNRFNIISDAESKKIHMTRVKSIHPELFKIIKV